MKGITPAALVGAALALSCTAVLAQKDTADAIARYRQLLQDGNPAELVLRAARRCGRKSEDREDVARAVRSRLGPGVVKGRMHICRVTSRHRSGDGYESRIVHCMVTQGFDTRR